MAPMQLPIVAKTPPHIEPQKKPAIKFKGKVGNKIGTEMI